MLLRAVSSAQDNSKNDNNDKSSKSVAAIIFDQSYSLLPNPACLLTRLLLGATAFVGDGKTCDVYKNFFKQSLCQTSTKSQAEIVLPTKNNSSINPKGVGEFGSRDTKTRRCKKRNLCLPLQRAERQRILTNKLCLQVEQRHPTSQTPSKSTVRVQQCFDHHRRQDTRLRVQFVDSLLTP